MSFETVGTLERTAPGSYDDPGWYISNTDPAEVFSSREEKSIILDEKRDENAFADFTETGVNITDSVSIFTGDVEDTTGDNILAKPVDWSNTEGREVTVTIPNKTLADETGGVTGAAVSAGAGTNTLTVTGL
ncbi:MAG: hypothetical protein GWO23_12905, partial [Gammaproteobacteria bacterium]|nr:hypothetical protein [Gammaproteobacteria bacterium]